MAFEKFKDIFNTQIAKGERAHCGLKHPSCLSSSRGVRNFLIGKNLAPLARCQNVIPFLSEGHEVTCQ